MSKSRLYFDVDWSALQNESYDLPVEVRRANLSLVGRGLTSQMMELDPGTYYVSARLPTGEEWSSAIEVQGNDATVRLAPDPADVSGLYTTLGSDQTSAEVSWLPETPSFATWDEAEATGELGGTGASSRVGGEAALSSPGRADEAEPVLEALGAETEETFAARVQLRVYKGNVLQGELKPSTPDDWLSSDDLSKGRIEWRVSGAYEPQLVQLIQPGVPPLNVMLPLGGSGCRVFLGQGLDGLYALDVQLANSDADALLRYWQRGFLQQATTIAASDALTAERLLYQKGQDAIGAAVGAYALLRFGDLERLHTWTTNLKNWFDWLPDGVTILAEHLAREGEHHQALEVLLELPSRGLPLFSEGFSYATERLGRYLSLGERHFKPDVLEQARALLDQLQPYTPYVDFNRPILTFTGLDPSKPNADPLSQETFANLTT